jgi:hypothetical protein
MDCRVKPGNDAGLHPESPMPNDSPWWRRPGVRLRHDMHLWIRHDAARFVRPGFDPADVFPTLARKPDAAKAAAFDAELAAEVAKGYRLNAVLREEVAEIRAEMKRRRALEEKYSPSQPRVPAGNPRGGQWTDRSGGGGNFGGSGTADGNGSTDGTGGGEDPGAISDTPLAFQADDSSGSLDDWNRLLARLADDESNPKPIPMRMRKMPITSCRTPTPAGVAAPTGFQGRPRGSSLALTRRLGAQKMR